MNDVLCNLCGLTCRLDIGGSCEQLGGLVNACAVGGPESTPGNGDGALDDTIAYTFSLCEFCLDWLFSRFKIPVAVSDDLHLGDGPVEPWRPAHQRVAEDKWRRMKAHFTNESARRDLARGGA